MVQRQDTKQHVQIFIGHYIIIGEQMCILSNFAKEDYSLPALSFRSVFYVYCHLHCLLFPQQLLEEI